MPGQDALTEKFLKLGARDQKQPCPIGSLLKSLKPAERTSVDQALRSDNDALRRGARAWMEQEHGLKVNNSTLGSHRNDTCTCAT